VGVVSEPDFTSMELTPEDRFIILASDGVWEFISNKEAVDIAAQYDSAEEACRQVRHTPLSVRGSMWMRGSVLLLSRRSNAVAASL
jgi:serine/threonine protein phosphatase PrpC